MSFSIVKTLSLAVLMLTTLSIATPTYWHKLRSGLEYTKIPIFSGFHRGYIHAFRIDLKRYDLKLILATETGNDITNVKKITTQFKGSVGINGGFFGTDLRPLGLRVADSKVKSSLKKTSWWGVFYVKNNFPYLVPYSQYRSDKSISFAVQSGPRLVVNNHIPILKPGRGNRSAIGITVKKQVIILVTENLSITTTSLAKMMQTPEPEGGLSCINAMNLDGGSSTQLYASIENFLLDVPGLSAVSDVIIVKSK